MAERKTLAITKVEEVKQVGANQIPKLSFRATDGDAEYGYFTFKRNLFDAIKEGQTISADIETTTQGEWTNRKVVQIYVDGQPVVGKPGQGYRGKSPEELELSAKSYALSYAKDLAVAQVIPLKDITKQADSFYAWLKGGKTASPTKITQAEPTSPTTTEDKEQTTEMVEPPSGIKVQNIAELKSLLMKHKIGTTDAYEILSISSFTELVDLDEAWVQIKEAKGV